MLEINHNNKEPWKQLWDNDRALLLLALPMSSFSYDNVNPDYVTYLTQNVTELCWECESRERTIYSSTIVGSQEMSKTKK